MGKYTVEALKQDLGRLRVIGKKPMGFRPSNRAAEDKERKAIKKRLRDNGFDVDVQAQPWITLEDEEDD